MGAFWLCPYLEPLYELVTSDTHPGVSVEDSEEVHHTDAHRAQVADQQ